MRVPQAPYRIARWLLACAVRHWPKETREWGIALAAEIDQTTSIQEALWWSCGGIKLFARSVGAGFWKWLKLLKEVRMSKRKLVLSMVGSSLAAAGWWAATIFCLAPPPVHSTQMIAYSVEHRTAGRPAMTLSLGDGRYGTKDPKLQVLGPVPVAMPAPPYILLAKKNKVRGDVEALLDVDTAGSVAGIRQIVSSGVGDAGLAKSVLDAAQTWKFKPAMEKGEPVPATVLVQVRF